MAQARHVECTAAPNPPPPPLTLVICLHRCIPVHSIPAEQPIPPPPPPPLLSLSLSLSHTHTHRCTVTCQQGSGGRRPLLLPLQERGVIQQGGRLPHPPNPTGTPVHSHTHTGTHTDRHRQTSTCINILLPSQDWRRGHLLYHTRDQHGSR